LERGIHFDLPDATKPERKERHNAEDHLAGRKWVGYLFGNFRRDCCVLHKLEQGCHQQDQAGQIDDAHSEEEQKWIDGLIRNVLDTIMHDSFPFLRRASLRGASFPDLRDKTY
jgi:hypothetical protein